MRRHLNRVAAALTVALLASCGAQPGAGSPPPSAPSAATTTASPSAQASPVAVTTRQLLVVPVGFSNSPPPDQAAIRPFVDGSGGADLVSFYKTSSYGALVFQASYHPPVTLPMPFTSELCGGESYRAQVEAAGDITRTDPTEFVIYVRSQPAGFNTFGCAGSASVEAGAADIALVPEAGSSFYRYDFIHEVGHLLGMDHAGAVRCPKTLPDPSHVDVNLQCTQSDYGDPTDVMGDTISSTRELGGYHRLQQGWLPQTAVTHVTASGTYTLSPVERPKGSALLEIDDPALYASTKPPTPPFHLFIDTRASDGTWDSGADWTSMVTGVEIHEAHDIAEIQPANGQVQLVDLHDEPLGLEQPPLSRPALAPGETWTDPSGRITITCRSWTEDGATVQVDLSS